MHMNHARWLVLVASLLVGACSDPTDPGFAGKTYTGTLSGQKSGSFAFTVNDVNGNSTGSASIENRTYPLVVVVARNGTFNGGGELISGVNTVVGRFSLTGKASASTVQASWVGTLPVSGTSTATASYSGTMTGSTSGAASSGTSSSALAGTWDLHQGSLLVARQVFTGATLAARTWSATLPQVDGAYAEYTYTSTSIIYTTSATLILLCDYTRGVWVADPSRPVGTLPYSVGNNGSSLTLNGGTYTRSSGGISRPSAGGSCTKL